MNRRRVLKASALAMAAWPPMLAAQAPQPLRMPRVGILSGSLPPPAGERWPVHRIFVERLRELGWTEGVNLQLEFRHGLGTAAGIAQAVRELVALKPEVLVASGTPTVLALADATRTIPVFNYAAKMVQLSPGLSSVVRVLPSAKSLIRLPLNVEYKALNADGTTAHGRSPILAILDEAGQVKGPLDAFTDAITTSQGAHESPLLIVISKQAADDADLFSIWLDDAKKSADPRIVSHVYEAPKDCDLMDRATCKAANPALGVFRNRGDLEEQAKQAERMPSAENTFRNLCLNQRVSTFAPFISVGVWSSRQYEGTYG